MSWKNTWKTGLLCFLSGLVSPLFAASLFEDHSPLEIKLTGPVWSLVKHRKDRNERPFKLSIDGMEFDIDVRARGNSRMRICQFPPLRFNFNKTDTAGTPFEGQDKLKLVYVFQYLIGNTDWSFVKADTDDHCCHNIKLISIDSKLFPVPYDFDLAGVVNASYAKPDPSLKIRNVRQRLYRGFCTDPAVLKTALSTVSAKEDEVLAMITDLSGLTEREKEKNIEYLEKVFRKADDQNEIIEYFEKACHP